MRAKFPRRSSLTFLRLEPRLVLHGLPGAPVMDLQVDVGLVTNAGVVSQWHDQSGHANDLIATGSERPSLSGTLRTPSGIDAVSLDGIDDRLLRTAAQGFTELPVGNEDRTFIVVAQFNSAQWNGGVSYGAGQPNETFGAGVIRNGHPKAGQIQIQGWGSGNDHTTNNLAFQEPGGSTGWMVLTITHDANATGNSTRIFQSNALFVGQEIGGYDHVFQTDLSDSGLLNGNSISRFVVGQEIAEGGSIEMDVAAIVAYDEALDDAVRIEAEEFLQEKYFFGDLRNQLVVPGFNSPTSLEVLPDGRVIVLEKNGAALIVDPTANVPSVDPYFTLTNINSDFERGLTDIALDPDFENSNFLYVYYHTDGATPRARVSRFTHHTDHVDLNSEFVVWEDIENSNLSRNHWGGGLDFGPDGKLYLTIGDKWLNAADSQSPTSYGGKILRLNTDGSIPTDNPFYGNDPDGFLDEIWAYGLRNPFRANWDLTTNRFFVGDVGGNVQLTAREEINLGVAGANYGWPTVEGAASNPLYTDPIFDYDHEEATPFGAAIAGGLVYRGGALPTEYDGAYFFGDYVQGWIRYLKFDPQGNVIDANPATTELDPFEFSNDPIAPVAFEVGALGELYFIDYWTGELREFVNVNGEPEITLASVDQNSGPSPLSVVFSGVAQDPEQDPLTYFWDFGDGNTGSGANPSHTYTVNGVYQATLQVSDGTHTTFSSPITISVGEAPVVNILTPTDGELFVAGQTIGLSASATDDGPLDESSYSWAVRFIHNAHTHPVLDGVIGSTATFDINTTGHNFSDSTGFEIELTVTDSDGLKTIELIEVFPNKVDIDFATNFPGALDFTVDAVPRPGPFTLDSLINFEHTISVPVTATHQGDTYQFTGWSDGELSSSYSLVVPNTNLQLTALYELVTSSGPTLPTDGLVFRVSGDTGVAVDGSGTVTDWSDQSGLDNHLTSTGNPQVVTGELNGFDIIRFDGTDDSAIRPTGLNSFPAGNSDRSFFVVVRYDSGGYGGVSYGDNSLNETFGPAVNPAGNLIAQGWGSSNDFHTSVAGTGQGWMIQEILLTAGTMQHFKDGQLIDSQNHNYATDVANGNGLVIGAEVDSAPFVDMDVAEILLYDKALTTLERQEVETYLLYKYFAISNTAPIAVDDSFSVVENSANVAFDVKADNGMGIDTDPDFDPISIIAVGSPTMGGSVAINDNGTPSDTTDDFVEYTPAAEFVGMESFTYTLSDGLLDDQATVTITVTESNTNEPPTNSLPGTQTIELGTTKLIPGISIADSDANGANVSTQLHVDFGSLELSLAGSATITSGSNQSANLTLSGTIDDINATLASLQYSSGTSIGTTSLTVTTDDLGNTGPGGPQQDTDSLLILVTTPLLTSDLVIRLDGQTGIATDANGITDWDDQSGFGNDLSGTGNPQIVDGGLNGLDYISFDGSGDSLTRTLNLNQVPGGNDDRSLFVVVQYDGGGYGGVSYGDNSLNETFGAAVNPAGNLIAQAWGSSNDFHTNVVGTGQGWMIQEIVLSAGLMNHFKDGLLIDSQLHNYATDVANGNGFVVGAEIDSNPFVDMNVSEILLYDRALTDSERNSVESYLLGKYFGVYNALPIAVDDLISVNADSVANVIDVTADNGNGIDSDPEGSPISVVALTTPDMGGSVNINDNGTVNDPTDDFLEYTPASSFVGSESFSYTISDGEFVDTAIVTIDVTLASNLASFRSGTESQIEPRIVSPFEPNVFDTNIASHIHPFLNRGFLEQREETPDPTLASSQPVQITDAPSIQGTHESTSHSKTKEINRLNETNDMMIDRIQLIDEAFLNFDNAI